MPNTFPAVGGFISCVHIVEEQFALPVHWKMKHSMQAVCVDLFFIFQCEH